MLKGGFGRVTFVEDNVVVHVELTMRFLCCRCAAWILKKTVLDSPSWSQVQWMRCRAMERSRVHYGAMELPTHPRLNGHEWARVLGGIKACNNLATNLELQRDIA